MSKQRVIEVVADWASLEGLGADLELIAMADTDSEKTGEHT